MLPTRTCQPSLSSSGILTSGHVVGTSVLECVKLPQTFKQETSSIYRSRTITRESPYDRCGDTSKAFVRGSTTARPFFCVPAERSNLRSRNFGV